MDSSGKKTNFGFNVKYGSNGSNLKGNMNVIFRRTEAGVERTYQIKANALQSLAVDARNPKRQTGQFITKSNLTDITNPLLPVSKGGNLYLYVNMIDNGEPGINDSISFTLVPGGSDPAILSNIMYSSNWISSKTQQMKLSGGNLVVHSGFSVGIAPTIIVSRNIPPVETPIVEEMVLKAYPNPSTAYFVLNVKSRSSENVQLKVTDMRGRPMYSIKVPANQSYKFGDQFASGPYFLEVIQGQKKQILKLIKLK